MATKATTKKTSKATVNENIKLQLVDAKLEAMKLDKGGTALERVDRLEKHYAEKTKDKDLGHCDVCGRDSNVKEPACPFCGDAGEIIHEGEPVAAKDAPKPEAPAPGTKPKLQAIDGGKTKPSTALAPRAPDAPEATATVLPDRLNAAVEKVQELKRASVVCFWHLGASILDIYAEKLYLQRTREDGAPLYKTWTQFVARELGMTAKYTYDLMDIAANFSADDVRAVGTTKLRTILVLGPEDRAKLLEKAKEGLPRSELAKEVRKLAGGDKATPARETGRKGFSGKPGKRAPAAGGDAPEGKITVAMVYGRTRIPLLAKPKNKAAPPKNAKTLADEPRAVEVLENGVEVSYQIVKNPKGEMILIVDRKRATPAS